MDNFLNPSSKTHNNIIDYLIINDITISLSNEIESNTDLSDDQRDIFKGLFQQISSGKCSIIKSQKTPILFLL